MAKNNYYDSSDNDDIESEVEYEEANQVPDMGSINATNVFSQGILRDDLSDKDKDIAQQVWEFVREFTLPADLGGITDAERLEAFSSASAMDIFSNFKDFDSIKTKIQQWDVDSIKQNDVIQNKNKGLIGVVLKKFYVNDLNGYLTKYQVFTEGGIFAIWESSEIEKTESKVKDAEEIFNKVVKDLKKIKDKLR
ncbi:MAG: hypothetical protein K6G11_03580 [Lachnospiraceae bacterium]|nr:hypothetical protein [Lachnospiraceae bacterium]